jgi:hypothetical protein
VRLKGIAPATKILQGLLLLQQQGHKDWKGCACNNDGARFIAPLVTTLERSCSRTMLGGSERSHAPRRRHEAYHSGNNKVAKDCACNTNVARLGEITLTNKVARLREIALTTTMSRGYHRNNKVARIGEIVLVTTMGQGSLLLSQRRWRDCARGLCWEALRDGTRQDNVTGLIALETTRSQMIVLATPMLQDSERSRSQTRL